MRKLSDYQKTPWMKKISKLPHKWPDRKGEKNPNCWIPDEEIDQIRRCYGKWSAEAVALSKGISERYVYQLWAWKRRK